MARILPILDDAQRLEFDRPPSFTNQQRKFFFTLPNWAEEWFRYLRVGHMQLGFLLQVGYFKASGRFFSPTHFHLADQLYLKRRYQILGADLTRYEWVTIGKHRKLILHHFGITPFTKEQCGTQGGLNHRQTGKNCG